MRYINVPYKRVGNPSPHTDARLPMLIHDIGENQNGIERPILLIKGHINTSAPAQHIPAIFVFVIVFNVYMSMLKKKNPNSISNNVTSTAGIGSYDSNILLGMTNNSANFCPASV